MTARAAALAAALAVALAGCGGEAPDLLVVQRGGTIPGARLRLRVTDDGRASCNGRPLVAITSRQLIDARQAGRDLDELGTRRLAPGGPGVLNYRVRSEGATVTWSDRSARQPQVLFVLAKLARDIAKGSCALSR